MALNLETWLQAARLPNARLADASLLEGERVYASPLGIAEGATTVHCAVAGAIERIWYARTGRHQEIAVDTRHAELSMASTWLLRIDGELAVTRFPMRPSPIEGRFECAGGESIYLLCVFPNIVRATANVLGCELTPEGVAAAVRRRNSTELEQALTECNLTGVVVRDHEAWLKHPQGRVLRDQPVVHIERISDAPPISLPDGERPLAGLRVLDATRVIAGPMCSRTLAEFGADVLQVSPPGLPDLASSEADTAHGKHRAELDLGRPEGKELMRDLLADADVFVQSYRPGSFARRGFGPTDVAAIRPGIIYLTVSAYGATGPWQDKPGFDGSIQAVSGILSLHDRPVGSQANQPGALPMAINDYCTGYWGAYGVLEALQRRAVEGGSWHVQVSLAQTARWFMRPPLLANPSKGLHPSDVAALTSDFTEDSTSAYGRLTRLKPVAQMSETPPHWSGPTARPGNDDCRWL